MPWRERPRVLAASAIPSAATVEVAHATLNITGALAITYIRRRDLSRIFAAFPADCTYVIACELPADICREAPHLINPILARIGHHDDQDRAVLDVVKALAALDPAGFQTESRSTEKPWLEPA